MNLIPATLIKRYKRFLADVILDDGNELTVHCPNTGSMKNCGQSGDRIWLSKSANPKRKYAYTWELTETSSGHFICVNTQRANPAVADAIANGQLPSLAGYKALQREIKYGDSSRVDIRLSDGPQADVYVEVKSCTLLEADGCGYFPDAVTARGQKHLRELMATVAEGKRAMLIFAVMHTGISSVYAAKHIDPNYAELLTQAANAGVEVLACYFHIKPGGITFCRAGNAVTA
ncbi:sugar fermentation stimulation protein [Neiella marina]|uniref:Sugar fermentation stimulation protein homolog n=1 Tax=Neiella marina TaxID=508461 RepID=A0A8J2U4E3_9GAMM|nr:DNA/RNA nuclease SfsA [Neiella marina]GGA74224.1 sugar fermentation stimulation protein [Neiella marina]